MNAYLISLILGIVEGLTEFLPISSTAHIRIASHYMGVSDSDIYWKAFAVIIQFGSVACLPIYFWPRIKKMLKTFPKGERGDRNIITHPLSLTMVAFACTAAIALPLKKVISKNLENFEVIALALLIGGVIMWVVDVMFKKGNTKHMEEMSLPQAIWVGVIQSLSAIFPGTSRSMSTIAAGQTGGMDRHTALEFSFFLCIPTMVAATAKETLDVLRHKDEFAALAPLTHDQYIQLAIGLAAAFVVGLVIVHLFMSWVRKHGFIPFAIYRIVLGAALMYLVMTHRL
ncbi:undecaprenyl-diphosphate phosphatase [soil metagenome]